MSAFSIKWRRNYVGGFQEGTDTAADLAEAHALAILRLANGGIPAAASIYHGETKVRAVFKDFDARIGYQDVAQAA